MSSSEEINYNRTARLLHWLVAGLIVVQYVLAKLAERAEDADSSVMQLGLLANHKSVGVTILALVLVRLIWRLLFSPPPLPPSMPRWQVRASGLSHTALYLLIIALPVSGWLMSSASAYSVSWFNLLVLPDFIAPDADLKHTLEEIHETLAKLLFVLALLHVLAALKHALIDKDGVLGRMTSLAGLLLFAGVITTGVITLSSPGKRDASGEAVAPSAAGASTANQALELNSSLPAWKINYAASYIRFQGSQAGAKFDGEWLNWAADIHFSKDALSESVFNVTVNTREVDTEDGERDATLLEADWFDVEQFPTAKYQSTQFKHLPDANFQSNGILIIKGNAVPVSLSFTANADSGTRVLRGTTNLLRLDHSVGVGEWQDTEWVNNEVLVEFYVESY